LFHYTKYARRAVSIVLQRQGGVENWVWNGTAVVWNDTLPATFWESCQAASHLIAEIPGKHRRNAYPLNAFFHFTGKSKPWLNNGPGDVDGDGDPVNDCCLFTAEELASIELEQAILLLNDTNSDRNNPMPPQRTRIPAAALRSPRNFWFYQLWQWNVELDLGLNFSSHWRTGNQRPPLGLYPIFKHLINARSNLITPLIQAV